MQPESAKLLRDMLDSAEVIVEHTRARTFDDYQNLRWVRDTVQWNFTVIGEALSQLHKLDAVTAERVTEWPRIIGFRNQLVHGYGVVDHLITWNIIQEKLPILMRELQALLNPPPSSGQT